MAKADMSRFPRGPSYSAKGIIFGAANRRAEMWMTSKDWRADPAGAQIPDSDALQADACGPGYGYDVTV